MDTKEKSQNGRLSPLHQSAWLNNFEYTVYPTLAKNIETEIVIIGGGLAGISTAYCLSSEGRKVVIIEDGDIGSGETGHTTAHLVTALDDRFFRLEKLFGEEDTRLIVDSHKAAIDFVERTVRKEKIDCQFERLPGYLFLHPTDDKKALDDEFEAASRAGLQLKKLDQIPGMKDNQEACLMFPNQAQFHPLLYLKGLCTAVEKNAGQIFTNTHASIINKEGIITNDGYFVKADHVVVATNSPVNNIVATHLKQTAFRTYVIAGLVKKGILPHALWWDTGDHKEDALIPPYHYIRLTPYDDEYDLLISGGEDHPTGDMPKADIAEDHRYQLLEGWTRERFPIEEILYRWSGQVEEPADSIAYIGKNPMDKSNVYIITGDSGTGMTHCTIGGMLICDLIQRRKNPWEKIYKPSRLTLASSPVFFKELIRGIAGLLQNTPADQKVKDVLEVQPGEGKICSIDGHLCGVYHDDTGDIEIVTAKCTHLGATLHWNPDEKSWDCPWHGSRFSTDGQVLNGPANRDLPSYMIPAPTPVGEE